VTQNDNSTLFNVNKKTDKTLTLRVNADLKTHFEQFCARKGVTISLAVRLYVYHFVQGGKLPRFGQANTCFSGNSAKIGLRIDGKLYNDFSVICKKYQMPLSLFIRDYMRDCIENNDFPFDIHAYNI